MRVLKEAASKFYYEDAVDYIESQGISCNPGDYVGEYVCDLLDDMGKYDRDGELYYTKTIINQIIKEAKEKAQEYTELFADDDEEEDRTSIRQTPDPSTLQPHPQQAQGWHIKFNSRATTLIKQFLTERADQFVKTYSSSPDKWFIKDENVEHLLNADEIYVSSAGHHKDCPLYEMFVADPYIGGLNIYTSPRDGKFIPTLDLEKDRELVLYGWYDAVINYLSTLHSFGQPLDKISLKDLVPIADWNRVDDAEGNCVDICNNIQEIKAKYPQLLEALRRKSNKMLKEGFLSREELKERVEPLIDEIDEFEAANRNDCYITWNFGQDRDGNVTAGVDLVVDGEDASEENIKDSLEAIFKKHGFGLDDNIKHENPIRTLLGAWHYQIKEMDYEDWHDTADQEQVDQPDYTPELVDESFDSILDMVKRKTEDFSLRNGFITCDTDEEKDSVVKLLKRYYDDVEAEAEVFNGENYYNVFFADPNWEQSIDESLKEAHLGPYKYKYEVYWVSPHTGENSLLGASKTYEGAVDIAKNQIDEIASSPWENKKNKIKFIQTTTIADADFDFLEDEEELADYKDKVIASLNESLKESKEPTKDDIIDWLSEHDQAWEDACDWFGSADLSEVDYDDIISWIFDHDMLSDDLMRHFGKEYFIGEMEGLDEDLASLFQHIHDTDEHNWNLHGTDYTPFYDELEQYLKPGETLDARDDMGWSADTNVDLATLFRRMPKDKQMDFMDRFYISEGLKKPLKEGMDAVRADLESIERFLNENGKSIWWDVYDYNTAPMGTSRIDFQVEGDWKHDHWAFKDLIQEWADKNDRKIFKIDSQEVGESDSDNYTAIYSVYIAKDEESFNTLNSMRALFAEDFNGVFTGLDLED